VLIAAFWKVCGASESAVSVADTGSYTAAQIHLFTGCDTTNPIHITAGSVQASAATAWTLPSVTTTINDTLVVLAIGLDRDLGSTTTVDGWTNAGLTNIVEQTDQTVNSGAGGGLAIATADYLTAGTTGTTAVTAATSTTAAFLTIALRGKVLLETSGTSVSTALAALTTVPVGAELVSSKTGVDTVTLDSWVEAGDLAICMAFNEAGTTVPSLPSGCTSHDASSGTAVASRLASKVLTAGGVQTIGPFTGATSVACNVYRNVDPSAPIGNVVVTGGTGTTVTLPAVTTNVDDFVVAFAGHQSTDVSFPVSFDMVFTATARTLPTSGNWTSAAYGNGTFVAVAQNSNAAATSSDGVTWTARTLPTSSTWVSVAYGSGVFVAIAGAASTAAASSADGITWTARTLPSASYWYMLTYGNGVFVAVSTSSSTAAASSSDGVTWTARTMPSAANWRSVAYGGTTFVALAFTSATAASSADGITWTARTLPLSRDWFAVAYGNGTFVAVAQNSTSAATSSDGITWATRTMPSAPEWNSIQYGDGVFLAVAGNPSTAAASSTDGITWTTRTMPSSSNWRSVAYGNGEFVAVSYTSGTTAATVDVAAVPLLRRAQEIDATDAIVVYDSAGAVP
jgi:hypothetical protein